jgi:hypothetical protein
MEQFLGEVAAAQSTPALWKWIVTNAEALIALAAMVIAAGSLWLQMRHNKLSVRPHLTSDALTDAVAGTYTINLRNAGLGPAFITEFKVLKNGVSVSSTGDATPTNPYKELIGEVSCTSQFSHIYPGSAILPGATVPILAVKLEERSSVPEKRVLTVRELHKELEAYDLLVHYKSAYGTKDDYDTAREPSENVF